MKHILVVEDVAYNRAKIVEWFNDWEVSEAKNGLEALQIIRSKSDLDGILLDMKMPDMDGYQTLKALQREGYTIPVVVIANEPDKARIQSINYAHMRGYATGLGEMESMLNS